MAKQSNLKMVPRKPLDALDHQLSARRVGEIRKEHDQRPPPQPRGKRGEGKSESAAPARQSAQGR